jgi:hypothetical protein
MAAPKFSNGLMLMYQPGGPGQVLIKNEYISIEGGDPTDGT